MNDELMGFVVAKPKQTTSKKIYLRIGKRNARMSGAAVHALGNPQHVNVFLDEKTNRVMVKTATEDMANTFFLGLTSGDPLRTTISSKTLVDDLKQMFGGECMLIGHVPDGCEGMVIFDRKVQ